MTGPAEPRNGLVLTGGGARAAYQVGVLKALNEVMETGGAEPFRVFAGTSAGAINAAALGCFADEPGRAVRELERIWAGFRTGQVFAADPLTMLKSSLHWFATVVSGGVLVPMPRCLLDNRPLRGLLQREMPLERIPEVVHSGALHALGVTASGYSSARSVTFFDGAPEIEDWARTRREGRRERFTVDHLMASISLPLVFPATRLGGEYFGDGSLRQAAPLSPALHLGADRIVVITLRDEHPDPVPTPDAPADYPGFGQVAGYMLDALFTDSLYTDAERLRRINATLGAVDRWHAGSETVPLRPVDLAILTPSEDIREIAARHVHELPRSVRALLWGVGALGRGGLQLVSYLLFERAYTRELLELGYRDGRARADELLGFLNAGIIGRP